MEDDNAFLSDYWAGTSRYRPTSSSFRPQGKAEEYLYCEELASGAIHQIQTVKPWSDETGNLVFDLHGQEVIVAPTDPNYKISYFKALIIKRYQKEKVEPMNENIELLNLLQAERGVKTCLVKTHGKTVTVFKIPPQIELTLDDQVLVQINGDFQLGKIVGLHDEAEFDFDKPITYDWIIQKLDLAPYNELLDEEKTILRKLRRAAVYERLKRTVEVRKQRRDAAYERLKRTVAAGGFDLNKIETPFLSTVNGEDTQ